jgi:hypothetical protein
MVVCGSFAATADVTDTVDGAGVDESFFLPNKLVNIIMLLVVDW